MSLGDNAKFGDTMKLQQEAEAAQEALATRLRVKREKEEAAKKQAEIEKILAANAKFDTQLKAWGQDTDLADIIASTKAKIAANNAKLTELGYVAPAAPSVAPPASEPTDDLAPVLTNGTGAASTASTDSQASSGDNGEFGFVGITPSAAGSAGAAPQLPSAADSAATDASMGAALPADLLSEDDEEGDDTADEADPAALLPVQSAPLARQESVQDNGDTNPAAGDALAVLPAQDGAADPTAAAPLAPAQSEPLRTAGGDDSEDDADAAPVRAESAPALAPASAPNSGLLAATTTVQQMQQKTQFVTTVMASLVAFSASTDTVTAESLDAVANAFGDAFAQFKAMVLPSAADEPTDKNDPLPGSVSEPEDELA